MLQNSARFLTEREDFYSVEHSLDDLRVLQRQIFVDDRNSFNNFRYCRFLLQIGIVQLCVNHYDQVHVLEQCIILFDGHLLLFISQRIEIVNIV